MLMFWNFVSTFWDKLTSLDREQWENFWSGLSGMSSDLINKSTRFETVTSLTNQTDTTDYYDIKIGPLYSQPTDLDPTDQNSNNIIKPIGTVVLEPVDGVYNDLIEITADDYYKIRSIGIGQYVVIGDKYFEISNLLSSEESDGRPCSIEINSTINIVSQSDIGAFGIRAEKDVSDYKVLIRLGADQDVIWYDDGVEIVVAPESTVSSIVASANAANSWGYLYSKSTNENVPILNYDTDLYPESAFTFSTLPEFVEFEDPSGRFYQSGAMEWHWYDGYDSGTGTDDNGYFTFDKLKYMIQVNGSLAYLGIEPFNFYLTNAKVYKIDQNVVDLPEISNFIDKQDDGVTLVKNVDYLFYNNTIELFNRFGSDVASSGLETDLIIGSNHKFEWDSTNLAESDFVKIEVSRNCKISWETLSSSTKNSGVYYWMVSGPASSNCYFKVSDVMQPTEIFGVSSSFRIVTSQSSGIVDEDTFYCKSTPIIEDYLYEMYGTLVGMDQLQKYNHDRASSVAAIHGLMMSNQNIDYMGVAHNIYYGLPIAPDGGRIVGLYESYGYEITVINGNIVTLNIENSLSPLIAVGSKMMCEGVGDIAVTALTSAVDGQIELYDTSDLSVGDKLYLKLFNKNKIISYVAPKYISIESDVNKSCLNHLINTMLINDRHPEILVYNSDIDGVYHLVGTADGPVGSVVLETYYPSAGETLYNDNIASTSINVNAGYAHVMWPTHKFLYIILDSGDYYKAYLDSPVDTILDTDDRVEKFDVLCRNASMKKFPGWNEFNYFRKQSGINYESDLVEMTGVIPGAEFGKYFPSEYSSNRNYI
jgi:hypothetical protein